MDTTWLPAFGLRSPMAGTGSHNRKEEINVLLVRDTTAEREANLQV